MMVNDRGAEACDGDDEFAGRDAVAGQYALEDYGISLSDADCRPTVLEAALKHAKGVLKGH